MSHSHRMRRFASRSARRRLAALLTGCSIAALPALAAPALADDTTGQTTPTSGASQPDASQIVVTGTHAVTGTKTDTPLTQIPQSISVVTAEQMRDQTVVNFQDAFRYQAGVTTATNGVDVRGDFFTARGFATTQYLDGINRMPSFVYGARMDPFTLERAEVLRGPSAVLYGAGGAGGLFNGVSKRPKDTFSGEIDAIVGTDERKELQLDVTGPITEGISARFVGVAQDANLMQESQKNNRLLAMPSVTFKPGPDTEITLIGLYQKDDMGTQTYVPISKTIGADNQTVAIPYDEFLGDPGYNRMNSKYKAGTLLVKQKFGDAITFESHTRVFKTNIDYAEVYAAASYADAAQTTLNRYYYERPEHDNGVATDNTLAIKFTTGPLEHQVLFGVDYTRFKQNYQYGFDAAPSIDVYDPDYSVPFTTSLTVNSRTLNTQLGFYAQDQIRAFDRVSLLVGLRHDKATSRSNGVQLADNSAWTFRAGIIGDVTRTFSPYFSFSQSFLPVFGTDFYGKAYVPRTGRQFEGGFKWAPVRAALITASVFDIREKNYTVQDPNNIQNFLQTGEVGSKGAEVQADVTLPGRMQLTASYTYINAKYLKDTTGLQGLRIDNLPRHAASIWGTKSFDLPSGIGMKVGMGVRYQGDKTDAYENFVTPSTTLVDGLVSFDWKDWSFSVNGSNLFNTHVYTNCNWTPGAVEGFCYLGEDRVVMGTLRRKF